MEQILQDNDIEAVLMTAFYSETFPFDLQMIVDFQNKYHKPIFCWLFGISEKIKELFNKLSEQGVNCFYNLEEMMKNMKILIR